MSDLSRALVPYGLVENQVVDQENQDSRIRNRSSSSATVRQQRRRFDTRVGFERLPSFLSFVTNSPFTLYFSSSGVVMDRNQYPPYPYGPNGYPSGSQQQHHNQPGQYPEGMGMGMGQAVQPQPYNHNPHVNHYHGSSFNFFFANSGAYDVNFPGLNGGNPGLPYNQQQQQIHPNGNQLNQGVAYPNAQQNHSPQNGFHMPQAQPFSNTNYGAQPTYSNLNYGQPHNGHFNRNEPIVVLPPGHERPEFRRNGGQLALRSGQPPLRRSQSFNSVTSSSDGYLDEIAEWYSLSQSSRKTT